MLTEVKKRDGRITSFNELNIRRAILNANNDVSELEQATDDEIDKIIAKVKNINHNCIHIEVIQNMIETALMELQRYALAKAYITYRYIHNVNRQLTNTEKSVLGLIRGTNKEVIEENSNKNAYTNSTQRDLMAGEISKDISDKFILDDVVRKADEDCILHWHDKDYTMQPMINCMLIDIKDVLDNGTVMNGTLIESPHSFKTACNIATQVIANIASNQYGGQSINIGHLAKYLAISRERLTIKMEKRFKEFGIEYTQDKLEKCVESMLREELEAGIQTIQYQIITLMTTNGQAPFLSVFMYLDENSEYLDDTALIIEEIIRQRHEGIKNKDGVYITPPFPKLLYVLDENNYKPGTKYWYITEKAIRCSIKRSYPDYISAKKMRENYEGNVFSCMGCRSWLAPWKKTKWYVDLVGEPESEIGKYKFEGRFNQGVVTINLPQIAILADHDMNKFFELLHERLSLCYKALLLRHKLLRGVISDTSPLHWQFGAVARLPQGAEITPLLEDGYSSISLGYIGIYEMTYAMLGVSHTTPEGKEFALKVMKSLRRAVDTWKEETGLGFALYGTPAESLCYTFARHDYEQFGSIKNVTDKGYYTNSYHIDVREHINAFEKFAFESEFQKISSGGAISYCEIPNLSKNEKALDELVTYIYDTIQYAEFNSKSDYCYSCGYDGEIKLDTEKNRWVCPCCGETDMKKMVVTRRTCGYLGVNDWNEGKRKEIGNRVLHL